MESDPYSSGGKEDQQEVWIAFEAVASLKGASDSQLWANVFQVEKGRQGVGGWGRGGAGQRDLNAGSLTWKVKQAQERSQEKRIKSFLEGREILFFLLFSCLQPSSTQKSF